MVPWASFGMSDSDMPLRLSFEGLLDDDGVVLVVSDDEDDFLFDRTMPTGITIASMTRMMIPKIAWV